MNMNKLRIRFLSALVLGPVALYIIFLGGSALKALLCVVLAISIYEWYYLSLKTQKPVLYTVAGFVYLEIAFLCFYFVQWFLSQGFIMENAVVPPAAILPIFLILLWLSDVCAYFAGKMIGGKKLWPSLSPNKTWAGFAAAALIPAAVFWVMHGIGFWGVALFVSAVCVLSQMGDLLISKFKRVAQVKDTGSLIPGHGGILDRIDGTLLVFFVAGCGLFGYYFEEFMQWFFL
jgi:phosphatidate cytidylyltransferase